ncbi:MAG TPA: S8 family peptidase [Candidatus Kapabacteria bacterium]|nr:S8 family peptidase [Candidatus Kapabacteria bacterium]
MIMVRKNLVLYILCALFAASGTLFAQTPQSISNVSGSLAHAPGFLYVKFTAGSGITSYNIRLNATGSNALDAVLRQIGAYSVEPFVPAGAVGHNEHLFGFDRFVELKFHAPEGMSDEQAAALLSGANEIENVGRKFYFKTCFIPNDPLFSNQWGLTPTKMDLTQAWDLSKGDSNIVIADIDEGVNYNHEDLAANIALNRGEMGLDKNGKDKRTNGIDDDGDGYVDNWHGWDLSGPDSVTKPDNDPMPGPGLSHGTNVAGTFGGVPNNGLGVAGTGFNCRILALKASPDGGPTAGYINDGYAAILYAAAHHAQVMNCSWGGPASDFNASEKAQIQSLIDFATASGSLICAAAGNSAQNIDSTPFFPASLNGVLAVGASNENDVVSSFSNYGHRVDLYAPGQELETTEFPGNSAYTGGFGGTSGATPNVAGIAGLVFAKHPQWKPRYVKRQLVETVDPLASPTNKNLYWGRANAYKALKNMPSFPLIIVSDYSIDGVDRGTLDYPNNEYTLSVVFKNDAGDGTNLSATLFVPDAGGYTIGSSAIAHLGSMAANASMNQVFKFTRDGTDDGMHLPLYFDVTDGKTYHDTVVLTLSIINAPTLSITTYSVDGVVKDSLRSLTKEYTLDVTFKNTADSGNLTVNLGQIKGYTVQQATAGLGPVKPEATAIGEFKFTRDGTDDHKHLPMQFYVTYDSKPYIDTIGLTLNISATAGVANSDGMTSDNVVTLAPNPARTEAVAYFNISHEGRITIAISDMLGRTVRSFDAGMFAEGANHFPISLDGLAPGVYFIRLEAESGGVMAARIVIQ